VDSSGSGSGPLAGCCECADEPSGSGATELVSIISHILYFIYCLDTCFNICGVINF
jgi:hypothetical protein